MYIYIYIYVYMYTYLSLSLYIYIYNIYALSLSLYIYIYMYVCSIYDIIMCYITLCITQAQFVEGGEVAVHLLEHRVDQHGLA